MSGILERIEGKLDQILASLAQEPVSLTQHVGEQAVEAPLVEQQEETTDPYSGVDAMGVVWDERIHSKVKEPKASTGKNKGCWKRKRGITDELYAEVLAELQQSAPVNEVIYWKHEASDTSGTAKDQAEFESFGELKQGLVKITKDEFDSLSKEYTSAPSTPVAPAPTAPSAPTAPASAPVAPTAPAVDPDKMKCVEFIKELTDTFNVDPADITGIMVEFGGADTLDKVNTEQMWELKLRLDTWRGWLKVCGSAIDAMTKIATDFGEPSVASLNEGLAGMFGEYNAEELGSVHYGSLATLSGRLDAYLASWKEL